MKTIANRFPWTVRLLAVTAVLMLAAYQTWSQSSTGPCEQTNYESIQAVSLHYLPGETVSVRGRGFAPSCDVTMLVNFPDGTTEEDAVATDPAGGLAWSYELGTATGDYSVQAVTAGGISLSTAQFSSGIYVMTDKSDYRPGDRVTFSGRGFGPGEVIRLSVRQTWPGGVADRNFKAVADRSGVFVNADFVVAKGDRNTVLSVTATGQSSGRLAEAVFSDANLAEEQKKTNQSTATRVTSLTSTAFTATPAEGNLLVAVVGAYGPASISMTSPGWTQDINETGAADAPSQAIFHRIAGPAEPTSAQVDFSGGTFSSTGRTPSRRPNDRRHRFQRRRVRDRPDDYDLESNQSGALHHQQHHRIRGEHDHGARDRDDGLCRLDHHHRHRDDGYDHHL